MTARQMTARPTSLAQVYLAGFAAEHLLTKRRPGQYSIELGLAILAHTDPALVSTFEGIEATDGYGAVKHILPTGVRPVDEELRAEVERLYEVARLSLSTVWPAVEGVASALLAKEVLGSDDIDEVSGDVDIYTPVAVQRAHGLLLAPGGPMHAMNGLVRGSAGLTSV